MVNSPDIEIQLVEEPDVATSEGAIGAGASGDIEMAMIDNAEANVEVQPGQFESAKSVRSNRWSQSDRKMPMFFKNIDPLFYITCLVCSGILLIGTYSFVKYNNRLIEAHLKEVEDGNKALNEQLSRIKSETFTGAEKLSVVSQGQGASMPSVQSQLLRVDEVTVAAVSEIDAPPELQTENPMAAQAENMAIVRTGESGFNRGNVRNEEIAQLQYLLDEKRQQLEMLALENHELRLRIEFGDTGSTDVWTTSAILPSASGINEFSVDDEEMLVGADQAIVSEVSPPTEVKAENRVESHAEVTVVDMGELINRADNYFKDKNYEDAGRLYLDVLQKNPGNRDANLGVASVALIAGNVQLAIDRYRHLLHLSPDDQSVFSSMLDLARSENSLETELQIHIEQRASEQSRLYSILGHYFGYGARWIEANAAFKAAHGSSGSPPADVLFNLAISYEHLGQVDNAVKYYKQVLAAPDNGGVNYALVQRRINELTSKAPLKK